MSESFVPEGSYAVTSTRDCKHEVWERDDASIDYCPICLRAQLSTATVLLKRLVEWDKRNNRQSVESLVLRDAIVADARAFVSAAEGKG